MVSDEPVPALVSLSEAQTFLRLDTGDEEALLAGLIRTASTLCEQFVGQALIERHFRELLPATGEWQRLRSFPVRGISSVSGIAAGGDLVPLTATDYGIDIDVEGRGWVRCGIAGHMQAEVRGTAGLARDVNAVPEPLRQGVLRLVAHLFADRDGAGGEPPAAVTALWRPYRRLSLVA